MERIQELETKLKELNEKLDTSIKTLTLGEMQSTLNYVERINTELFALKQEKYKNKLNN